MASESNDPEVSTQESPKLGLGAWKFVLLALVIIIGAFAIFVAMQPSDFRVTRSETIAAPPADVFPHVNDLHKWEAWSPWAKRDPDAKNTYAGAEAGEGAVFEWDGNDDIGAGRMTIAESRPAEYIKIDLDFLRPFEASNTSEFTFEPQGDQTVVTWSVYGPQGFIEKAVGLFIDFDEMLGNDFEAGLASMKSVVEGQGGS